MPSVCGIPSSSKVEKRMVEIKFNITKGSLFLKGMMGIAVMLDSIHTYGYQYGSSCHKKFLLMYVPTLLGVWTFQPFKQVFAYRRISV
jgi:hypothetical protein